MDADARLPRRPAGRFTVAALAATLVVGACTGSPEPSGNPEPPSGDYLIRAWATQALPAADSFRMAPFLVIDADGRAILPGAVPAIYPGPLVMPYWAQQLSPVGWSAVVGAARAAGLLSGAADFSGGGIAPGGVTAHLDIVVDGTVHRLIGDPDRLARCEGVRCLNPDPGTPEAFAAFWSRLGDLEGLAGIPLGPEQAYVPAAYALLVGPPAEDPDQLAGPAVDWPLDTPLAEFGAPFAGDAPWRCGIVSGDAADELRPSLLAANQLTNWRDPDAPDRLYALAVRSVLPGDGDVCGG